MPDRSLPSCPCCDAARSVEPIKGGWYFCRCCAARFLLDEDGRVIRIVQT